MHAFARAQSWGEKLPRRVVYKPSSLFLFRWRNFNIKLYTRKCAAQTSYVRRNEHKVFEQQFHWKLCKRSALLGGRGLSACARCRSLSYFNRCVCVMKWFFFFILAQLFLWNNIGHYYYASAYVLHAWNCVCVLSTAPLCSGSCDIFYGFFYHCVVLRLLWGCGWYIVLYIYMECSVKSVEIRTKIKSIISYGREQMFGGNW